MEAQRRARGWDAVVSHWLVPSGAVGRRVRARRAPGDRARLGRAAACRRCRAGARWCGGWRGAPIWSTSPRRCASTARRGAWCRWPSTWRRSPRRRRRRRAWRRARALDLDGFVVAFLGRLIHDKGVDRAIDALPDGATLLVGGDGPERASLVRRAARAARALPRPRRRRRQAGAARRRRCAGRSPRASTARRRWRWRRSPPACRSWPRAPAGCPSCSTIRVAIFCERRADSIAAALARLRDDAELRAAMSQRLPRARAAARLVGASRRDLWNRSVTSRIQVAFVRSVCR